MGTRDDLALREARTEQSVGAGEMCREVNSHQESSRDADRSGNISSLQDNFGYSGRRRHPRCNTYEMFEMDLLPSVFAV